MITVKKQQQQQQPKSGGFTRNFDSGVWMGSDDSEELFGEGLEQPVQPTRQNHVAEQGGEDYIGKAKAATALNHEIQQHFQGDGIRAESDSRNTEEITPEDRVVRGVIANCMENGKSTDVDLS